GTRRARRGGPGEVRATGSGAGAGRVRRRRRAGGLPVKIAAVVPRYGAEVIGGCESAVRELSEWLVKRTAVEVLTTTALDSTTWAEHFPAGTTREAGVTVHRYPVTRGRSRDSDTRGAPL